MTPEEAFQKWVNEWMIKYRFDGGSGKYIYTSAEIISARAAWLEATRQAYEASIEIVLSAGGDNATYHADAIKQLVLKEYDNEET